MHPNYDHQLTGTILNITNGCPGSATHSTMTVLNPATISVQFTGLSVGVDHYCLVLTDSTGRTDTIFYTLTVIPRTDTLRTVVQTTTSNSICYPTLIAELPGTPGTATAYSVTNLVGTYAPLSDSCISYTAGTNSGYDTIRIVNVSGGWRDTTIIIIHVVPHIDAVNDHVTLQNTNTSVNIGSLHNDQTGGQLQNTSPVIVHNPVNGGQALWNPHDSVFVYTPPLNRCGLQDSFMYRITNVYGFSDSAWVVITVTCPDVHVYQGFSPNNDGFNEYFHLDNIEMYSTNNVKVFNRWGNKVFETDGYDNSNPQKRFNGNFEDTALPDGTYFYFIQLNNDSKTELHGYIEIRR
jgi:gliding motility-associated-like protein